MDIPHESIGRNLSCVIPAPSKSTTWGELCNRNRDVPFKINVPNQ